MSDEHTADGHSPEEGAREPRHPQRPLGFSDPAVRAKAEETRRNNARMRREAPFNAIRQDIVRAVPDLGKLLVAAAKGEPPYESLPTTERLKALFKALEYGIGRPEPIGKTMPAPGVAAAEGEAEPDEEAEEPEGLTFA